MNTDLLPRQGWLLSVPDERAVEARFHGIPESPAWPVLATAPTTAPDVAVVADNYWYEEWKALRRRGLGASEVACAARIPGSYGSPFAMWWNKSAGLEVEQETDEILVMGTKLEGIIGETWAERNPEHMLVRPGAGLYQHKVFRWLFSTPDFLAVTRVNGNVVIEPVECKAYDGGRGWGTPGTDQVPEHILCQLTMQCLTLGARRGHVARMKGKRITTYTVDMAPEDLTSKPQWSARTARWLDAAVSFLHSVDEGTPPPLDGKDATEAVLAFQYADVMEDAESIVDADIISRYRWALSHRADAELNLQRVRNEMRAAMGNAEYGVDDQGEKVAQRRVYKQHERIQRGYLVDGIWPVNRA